MQNCIDAVSNALARSKVGCLTAVSSPLPFAHVQLMRGEFQGSDQPFKDATDRYGRGKVDTHNLRKMYLTACETREVRENISPRNHPAITPQSPRNHPAHRFPRAPPLQGKRPVSAPLQTRTDAEQRTEALQDCLNAVSNALERKSCFTNGSLVSSDSCWLGSSLARANRSTTA